MQLAIVLLPRDSLLMSKSVNRGEHAFGRIPKGLGASYSLPLSLQVADPFFRSSQQQLTAETDSFCGGWKSLISAHAAAIWHYRDS
jgi:hypothetical protein